MGMAASQARFLSLTARKSNIEYEGQQINEQRLTAAETQKTEDRSLRVDLGEESLLAPVKGPAQDTAQQEESKVGKQGEIVRGGEPRGSQSQRE